MGVMILEPGNDILIQDNGKPFLEFDTGFRTIQYEIDSDYSLEKVILKANPKFIDLASVSNINVVTVTLGLIKYLENDDKFNKPKWASSGNAGYLNFPTYKEDTFLIPVKLIGIARDDETGKKVKEIFNKYLLVSKNFDAEDLRCFAHYFSSEDLVEDGIVYEHEVELDGIIYSRKRGNLKEYFEKVYDKNLLNTFLKG